jgi:hypothetical protein
MKAMNNGLIICKYVDGTFNLGEHNSETTPVLCHVYSVLIRHRWPFECHLNPLGHPLWLIDRSIFFGNINASVKFVLKVNTF